MIKGIIAGALSLIPVAVIAAELACPRALPKDDPNFCASFKKAAVCHCSSSGLPADMCQDLNAIYARMMSVFKTLERACDYQHETSTQDCIDNWNCYRLGGVDSMGKSCSSTQKPCV